MPDITTVWDTYNAVGDFSLTAVQTSRTQIAIAAAQYFGTGDGTTTAFAPAAGSNVDTVSVSSVYQNDWQGNQLLYTTARTNLIGASETIGGTGWTNGTGTYTTGAVAGPDGRLTALHAVAATVTSYTRVAIAVSAGADHTATVYIKQDTASAAPRINILDGTGENTIAYLRVAWSSGVPALSTSLGLIGSPQITTVDGVWYRVSFTFNAGTFTAARVYFYPDNIGATGGTYFDYPQVELGDSSTSYIPTTTAAVTVTDYAVSASGVVTLATAPPVNALLTWIGSYYSTTVTKGGYLENGDDLATAILISLYTDRSAAADDVDSQGRLPDGTADMRGWWGDLDQDYEIGSRLWLLDRAKQTDDTLQSAFDYTQEALQWMIDDGAVGQFEITVLWVRASTLGISVTAIKDGTSVAAVSYSSLWNTP